MSGLYSTNFDYYHHHYYFPKPKQERERKKIETWRDLFFPKKKKRVGRGVRQNFYIDTSSMTSLINEKEFSYKPAWGKKKKKITVNVRVKVFICPPSYVLLFFFFLFRNFAFFTLFINIFHRLFFTRVSSSAGGRFRYWLIITHGNVSARGPVTRSFSSGALLCW